MCFIVHGGVDRNDNRYEKHVKLFGLHKNKPPHVVSTIPRVDHIDETCHIFMARAWNILHSMIQSYSSCLKVKLYCHLRLLTPPILYGVKWQVAPNS